MISLAEDRDSGWYPPPRQWQMVVTPVRQAVIRPYVHADEPPARLFAKEKRVDLQVVP